MVKPKDGDENAKDRNWKVPVKLETVGKYAYDNTMSQSSGSKNICPIDEIGPADPAGKHLEKVTEAAVKLATQKDRSG